MRPASQHTRTSRTTPRAADQPRAATAPGATRRVVAAAAQPRTDPRAAAAAADPRPVREADCQPCCPYYHEAVELIGKRWTGAILRVLLGRGMRFSEIAQAVPELSDRLLSERMKELEARGVVARHVDPGPPIRVEYTLSVMGRDLEPALQEIQAWAQRWIAPGARRRP